MAGKKKRPAPRRGPNRNALCPCGSGRAYKNCCTGKHQASSDKPESLPNQFKRIAVGLIVLAVVAGGIALAMLRPWDQGTGAERQPSGRDVGSNRYWDADHGHWHEGSPPEPAAQSSSPAPTPSSPVPWEYDAARNQFWHPDHGHWHEGRPPPPDQRS